MKKFWAWTNHFQKWKLELLAGKPLSNHNLENQSNAQGPHSSRTLRHHIQIVIDNIENVTKEDQNVLSGTVWKQMNLTGYIEILWMMQIEFNHSHNVIICACVIKKYFSNNGFKTSVNLMFMHKVLLCLLLLSS